MAHQDLIHFFVGSAAFERLVLAECFLSMNPSTDPVDCRSRTSLLVVPGSSCCCCCCYLNSSRWKLVVGQVVNSSLYSTGLSSCSNPSSMQLVGSFLAMILCLAFSWPEQVEQLELVVVEQPPLAEPMLVVLVSLVAVDCSMNSFSVVLVVLVDCSMNSFSVLVGCSMNSFSVVSETGIFEEKSSMDWKVEIVELLFAILSSLPVFPSCVLLVVELRISLQLHQVLCHPMPRTGLVKLYTLQLFPPHSDQCIRIYRLWFHPAAFAPLSRFEPVRHHQLSIERHTLDLGCSDQQPSHLTVPDT